MTDDVMKRFSDTLEADQHHRVEKIKNLILFTCERLRLSFESAGNKDREVKRLKALSERVKELSLLGYDDLIEKSKATIAKNNSFIAASEIRQKDIKTRIHQHENKLDRGTQIVQQIKKGNAEHLAETKLKTSIAETKLKTSIQEQLEQSRKDLAELRQKRVIYEAARQEAAIQEAARQEARQEAARQEEARQEEARQEEARRQEAKEEKSGRQEAKEEKSGRQEAEEIIPLLEQLNKSTVADEKIPKKETEAAKTQHLLNKQTDEALSKLSELLGKQEKHSVTAVRQIPVLTPAAQNRTNREKHGIVGSMSNKLFGTGGSRTRKKKRLKKKVTARRMHP